MVLSVLSNGLVLLLVVGGAFALYRTFNEGAQS